jgi:hypothetical protein
VQIAGKAGPKSLPLAWPGGSRLIKGAPLGFSGPAAGRKVYSLSAIVLEREATTGHFAGVAGSREAFHGAEKGARRCRAGYDSLCVIMRCS